MGLRKQFINNFVFPTWACAAGFNNNKDLRLIDLAVLKIFAFLMNSFVCVLEDRL